MSASGGKGGGDKAAGKGSGEGGDDTTAWIAVSAGTLGSLMATIDSSVVSASLPTIQGEIGASQSEGTWISTAYLVAEIVMIPIAAWLVNMFALRNFLIACTIAFTAFSILCGVSADLTTMIIGRVGQGFSGGAMIPTALTIVATRLPPDKRSIGIALFGFTAVFGPVAGPVLGGWLTENYSWHYAFFINVPLGVGLLALLVIGLPAEKTQLGLIREADWLGIGGLTLGLGALTVVLEDGQRERWLESAYIDHMIVVSIFGFALLLLGQFVAKSPVIRLRILLTRAFGSVFLLSLVVGAGLYGVSYMLPQFLSALAGYNAFQSGLVTIVIGLPSLLLMPLYPQFEKRLDLRLVIGVGLALYGVGCLMNTRLTKNDTGIDFTSALIVIGLGQFFSLIFLNSAATTAVNKKYAEDASGLFNAARNLGGSIGLAVIASQRENRTWFQGARLSEGVTANALSAQDYVRQNIGRMGSGDTVAGMERTYSNLSRTFEVAGTASAFSDIFFLFGVTMIVSVPLCLMLKPTPKGQRSEPA